MAKQNVYLDSKPRYEILDGLRGVASLMVIIFHLGETYCKPGAQQWINHGYLAVDFFFVLSGFVIGYAYDDRWGKMSLGGFFKRRLTRLHPMVVIANIIGTCLFFFGASYFTASLEIPFWKFGLCFIMGMFIIPCGRGLDIMERNELVQRPYMDSDVRVYRQHPLCVGIPSSSDCHSLHPLRWNSHLYPRLHNGMGYVRNPSIRSSVPRERRLVT